MFSLVLLHALSTRPCLNLRRNLFFQSAVARTLNLVSKSPPRMSIITNDDIRALYEKYGSWIFNRARSLLKDEQAAYEAMQDVFVKVLESGADFRGDSSPWTWLYRITTNHCL